MRSPLSKIAARSRLSWNTCKSSTSEVFEASHIDGHSPGCTVNGCVREDILYERVHSAPETACSSSILSPSRSKLEGSAMVSPLYDWRPQSKYDSEHSRNRASANTSVRIQHFYPQTCCRRLALHFPPLRITKSENLHQRFLQLDLYRQVLQSSTMKAINHQHRHFTKNGHHQHCQMVLTLA